MAEPEEQAELLTPETEAPQEEEAPAQEIAEPEKPAEEVGEEDATVEGGAEPPAEPEQEPELAADQYQQEEVEEPQPEQQPPEEHEYAEPPIEDYMAEGDVTVPETTPEDAAAGETPAAAEADIDEPIEKEPDEMEKVPKFGWSRSRSSANSAAGERSLVY